jgi:hypothetical protein
MLALVALHVGMIIVVIAMVVVLVAMLVLAVLVALVIAQTVPVVVNHLAEHVMDVTIHVGDVLQLVQMDAEVLDVFQHALVHATLAKIVLVVQLILATKLLVVLLEQTQAQVAVKNVILAMDVLVAMLA